MIIDLTREIKVVRPESLSRYPYSNSLYINDEIKAVIDAGSGGKAYREIPVNSVERLYLSHYHFDHSNGVSFFKNAAIFASQEEAAAYQNKETYVEFSGMKQWPTLMGASTGYFPYDYTDWPEDIPVKHGYHYIPINGLISDGKTYEFGKTRFTAVHTPGHSPGHYAFLFPEEGILFSGDIDLAPGGPYYAGQYSDFDELLKSVDKLIAIMPDILVTSHRKVFYRKKDNIEKMFREYVSIPLLKEEKILKYLDRPRTLEEISQQEFAIAYRRNVAYTRFWSKMMIIKHLERLEKYGEIMRVDNQYLRKG